MSVRGAWGLPEGVQWHVGRRDVLPRLCCNCHLLIAPGQRHHRFDTTRGMRRIHFRRCPGMEPASFKRQTAWREALNTAIASFAMLVTGAMLAWLMLALAGFRLR